MKATHFAFGLNSQNCVNFYGMNTCQYILEGDQDQGEERETTPKKQGELTIWATKMFKP